jgi:hypothetical protein
MDKEMYLINIARASGSQLLPEQEDFCISNNEKNYKKYCESVRLQVVNYKQYWKFPIGPVLVLQTTEMLRRIVKLSR